MGARVTARTSIEQQTENIDALIGPLSPLAASHLHRLELERVLKPPK